MNKSHIFLGKFQTSSLRSNEMQYENGLLEFLQSNGITQSDVALGSRISHVTINRICNKKLSPSKTLVGKITKYLIKEGTCSMDDVKRILPQFIAIKKEKEEKKEKIKVAKPESSEPKKEEVVEKKEKIKAPKPEPVEPKE